MGNVELNLKPRADCDFCRGSYRCGAPERHNKWCERTLTADVVITAFGFHASRVDWLTTHGVALEESGRIAVTKAAHFQTSNSRSFAGDNVRGADLVVTAGWRLRGG